MNAGGNMQGGMTPPSNSTMPMMGHRLMMMHMTIIWGRNAEVLFDEWPGYDRLGMYILALDVVFLLAIFLEWLSHGNTIRQQMLMCCVRIGLTYLVMLAVVPRRRFSRGYRCACFRWFFFFGSMAFKKPAPASSGKANDLPPMSCSYYGSQNHYRNGRAVPKLEWS